MNVTQWPGYRAVYTTGQISRICQVAPRTVSKWVDSGRLRGFRIPGSQDRRVKHRDLIAFMTRHGLDSLCPELFQLQPQLLAVSVSQVLRDRLAEFSGCKVVAVEGAFDLGLALAEAAPVAVVVSFGGVGRGEGLSLGRRLVDRRVPCVALVGEDGAGEAEALEVGYRIAPRAPWSATAILEACGIGIPEAKEVLCDRQAVG